MPASVSKSSLFQFDISKTQRTKTSLTWTLVFFWKPRGLGLSDAQSIWLSVPERPLNLGMWGRWEVALGEGWWLVPELSREGHPGSLGLGHPVLLLPLPSSSWGAVLEPARIRGGWSHLHRGCSLHRLTHLQSPPQQGPGMFAALEIVRMC